jgi:uncharacterized protein YwgA
MLRRQRTVLKLLSIADASVSVTQLQKLLFLLRTETFLGRDRAFYEFLPYKFGPYSFAAAREVESLVAYGYIESVASASSTSLRVSELGIREGNAVDQDTSNAITAVFSKYGQVPLRALMKDVYSRYSWYASKSDAKDLVPADAPKAKIAAPAVYTIGYEDRSVDSFFDSLLKTGIRCIIDVRANPVSRKYGFARKSLSETASKLGITYSHHPELGISSDRRKGVESATEFRQLFSYYETRILAARRSEVETVANLMKSAPSVLLCMEKESRDCHRSRLASRLAASTGMSVIDL